MYLRTEVLVDDSLLLCMLYAIILLQYAMSCYAVFHFMQLSRVNVWMATLLGYDRRCDDMIFYNIGMSYIVV